MNITTYLIRMESKSCFYGGRIVDLGFQEKPNNLHKWKVIEHVNSKVLRIPEMCRMRKGRGSKLVIKGQIINIFMSVDCTV